MNVNGALTTQAGALGCLYNFAGCRWQTLADEPCELLQNVRTKALQLRVARHLNSSREAHSFLQKPDSTAAQEEPAENVVAVLTGQHQAAQGSAWFYSASTYSA